MIRTKVVMGGIGRLIVIIGIAMLTCLFWAIPHHEPETAAIIKSATVTIAWGLILSAMSRDISGINFKEGIVVVSLGWVAASGFGSLPYIMSGYLPSFADAFFETVSGFTTTGASVVNDIEVWPKGLVYWRSLTQWLGGMGIIALLVSVLTGLGARAKQLFKAEVPGPVSDSVSPRIKETARKLWMTYVALSIACFSCLVIFGMNSFDALCHAFTTMATGGFSNKNISIAFYTSPAIQWTIIVFMFLAGTNFALHYFCYKRRNFFIYFRNSEFKLYFSIVALATFFLFLGLHDKWSTAGLEGTLRAACFQIVSIVTTTGFATTDFDLWPPIGAALLLVMMFVGGSSGSTGGSVKPGRYLIIINRTYIELKKMLHPKAVFPLRFGGRFISEDLLINVLQFLFLYFGFLTAGFLFLSTLGVDMVTSLSAAITCLGNIGPGFNMVGPMRNFSLLPDSGKYALSVLMLVGRLEIYPILVIFMPQFWRE